MNETQIGNKEIRKQEKKTKENSRSVVVVRWMLMCLMTLLPLFPAHLIHVDFTMHIQYADRKRPSYSDCYSYMSVVWTSAVSGHLE
jgi:hypothetical protein